MHDWSSLLSLNDAKNHLSEMYKTKTIMSRHTCEEYLIWRVLWYVDYSNIILAHD